MAKDWSRSALDDLLAEHPRLGAPEQGAAARPLDLPVERLGLAGLCLLVGLVVALVYGWPILMLTHFFVGMRSVVFALILVGIALLVAVAAWVVTLFEEGYWSRKRGSLSDWSESGPWK
jgi:hypothetical protein